MQIKLYTFIFTFLLLSAGAEAQQPFVCRFPTMKNKQAVPAADSIAATPKPPAIRFACHATLMPTEPLYVLDGVVITTAQFREVNVNTIESITILKEAPATALYGSRGAAGVILITTRRSFVVKDASSDLPVAGAVVEIENRKTQKKITVLTDSLGRFDFPTADRNLPLQFNVSSAGYETMIIQWNSEQDKSREILLQHNFKELEDVKVVGYLDKRCVKTISCGVTTVSECWMTTSGVRTASGPMAENRSSGSYFSVYPNPAPRNSVLQISLPATEEKQFNIRLLSADGKMIAQQKRIGSNGKNALQLQLPAGITAGVYLVSVSDETGKGLRTMQVVIQ